MLNPHPKIKYILDKHLHVERLDFTEVLELFDDATISPNRLRQLCGTLEITFTGYQGETRLPFLIPEVRAFFRAVRKEWPCAPYFCTLDNPFILIELLSHIEHLPACRAVSIEADNRGFDLITRKSHPEDSKTAIDVCFLEVKSRGEIGEIALTGNEYNTAKRLREDYWLYVVFHYATPSPSLNVLRDPSTLDWQPVVKVEHYRLKQDSLKKPVELNDDSPP